MRSAREQREGMALLTVLLLVAVMSVVAVAVLDDVRFSVRRATNAETQRQAQWYAAGAEQLARRQVARLMESNPQRTPLQPEWNGRRFDFPIEGGAISAVLTDGQNCFNLNSVVFGYGEDLLPRPEGARQLVALGRAVGLPEGRMRVVADSLTDWLDADAEALPLGAEDSAYAGLETPYRTGGILLAEVSELRAVKGVDDDLYRRLRPYVCALPVSAPAQLNVNTLTPAMAPLLTALSEGRIGVGQARAAIARTPPGGWSGPDAFWTQPTLIGAAPDPTMIEQTTVLTRFFDLRVDVDYGGARAVRTALMYARPDGGVQTVAQRWTPAE